MGPSIGFIFIIQGLFWGVLLGLLVFLIARRYSKKKEEKFEKRDN